MKKHKSVIIEEIRTIKKNAKRVAKDFSAEIERLSRANRKSHLRMQDLEREHQACGASLDRLVKARTAHAAKTMRRIAILEGRLA